MARCHKCGQEIKESVLEGRKLIAEVKQHGFGGRVGRYVTVLKLTCYCGAQVERRFENIPSVRAIRAVSPQSFS